MPYFYAGQRLTAGALNSVLGESDSDLLPIPGTTASTTYTATLTGGAACSCVFVAPTSGKVTLHYDSLAQNSGPNFSYASPQVRAGSTVGSGTVFLAAADENALTHNGTAALRYGGSLQVEGLTAGATYNVQLLHRVTAGTGTYSRKSLIAKPTT